MALRWLEGFESFGAAGSTGAELKTEFRRKYSGAETDVNPAACTSIQNGWGTGLGVSHRRLADHYEHIKIGLDAQTTWIVGFAFRTPGYTGFSTYLVDVMCESSVQVRLSITHGNKLAVYSGVGTTTRLGSSSKVLHPNTWYYVELKAYIHASAGTIDVQVNGVSCLSLNTLNTKPYAGTGADTIRFWVDANGDTPGSGNVAGMYDDIYVADGTAGINTFLGPVKVEVIRPTIDVNTDWTPSDVNADHYTLIDDTGAPVNTDYITGSTVNDTDLFDYGALSILSDDIKGVQINTTGYIDSVGVRNLKQTCTSNATQSDDAGTVLAGTTMFTITRLMPLNPDTSNAWDVAGVNAARFGVKVGD